MEETVVYTAEGTAGWQLAWADLTPWKGRTVTVAFRLTQPQGAYLGFALLDDVSLGTWITPVVQSVSPTKIAARWQGRTVKIYGENFISGAQVYFDNVPAASVQYISDVELEATIPAGLSLGKYDIVVANPGSQRFYQIDVIDLGTYLYLPLLRR